MKHKPPALSLRRALITRRIYRMFPGMCQNIQNAMSFNIRMGWYTP